VQQPLNFGTKTYSKPFAPLNHSQTAVPLPPETQEFQQTIRQLWVGKARNYRVLFVVEANQVFILHVRHSSRAFLKKDPEQS
jgi:hypothetical protein